MAPKTQVTACLACRTSKAKCIFSNQPTSSAKAENQDQDREDENEDEEDEDAESSKTTRKCDRCLRLNKKCELKEHKRGRKKGKVQQQQITRRIENIWKLVDELEELMEPEAETQEAPSPGSSSNVVKKSKSTALNGWKGADEGTRKFVNDLSDFLKENSVAADVRNGAVVREGDGSFSNRIGSSNRLQSPCGSSSHRSASRSRARMGNEEARNPSSSPPPGIHSSSINGIYTSAASTSHPIPGHSPQNQRRLDAEDERSNSVVSISIRPNNPLKFLGNFNEELQETPSQAEGEQTSIANSRKRTRSQAGEDTSRLEGASEKGKGKETDNSMEIAGESSTPKAMSFENLMNNATESSPRPTSTNKSKSNVPQPDQAPSKSWADYFSRGVFHPAYDCVIPSLDPVRSGLVTLNRAVKLFDSFFNCLGNDRLGKKKKSSKGKGKETSDSSANHGGNGISNFIHIFDPNLSSFEYIRKRSNFLLCVILLIASEYGLENDLPSTTSPNKTSREEEEEDISFASDSLSSFGIGYYEKKMEREQEKKKLKKHIDAFLPTVLNGSYKSVELAQACFLLANYQPVSKSATDDRTWFFLGNAIRLATEGGCNLACYSYQASEDTEHHQRQLRNVERLWISIWVLEKTIASQTGQRYNLSEDPVIASCSSWHQRPYALPQDEALVAFVDLRRIINRHQDGFHKNILKSLSGGFTREKEVSASKEGEDEHLELQLDFFRDCVGADLKRWSEMWLRDDEKENEIPSPLKFTGALYLHYSTLTTLSLPLRSGLDASSSSSNLSNLEMEPLYREAYGAALAYLTTFVDRFSNNRHGKLWLNKISNSMVVSTVYCAVFAIRLSTISNSWEKSNGKSGISKERIEGLCRKVAGLLEIAGKNTEKKASNASDGRFGSASTSNRSLGVSSGFARYLFAVLDRKRTSSKSSATPSSGGNSVIEANKRQRMNESHQIASSSSNQVHRQSFSNPPPFYPNISDMRTASNDATSPNNTASNLNSSTMFDLPHPIPFEVSSTFNNDSNRNPRLEASNASTPGSITNFLFSPASTTTNNQQQPYQQQQINDQIFLNQSNNEMQIPNLEQNDFWNWFEFGNLSGGLPVLDQLHALMNDGIGGGGENGMIGIEGFVGTNSPADNLDQEGQEGG